MNKTEKVPAGITCCVLPYFSTHISRLLKSRALSQEDACHMGWTSETLVLFLKFSFLSLSLIQVLDNRSRTPAFRFCSRFWTLVTFTSSSHLDTFQDLKVLLFNSPPLKGTYALPRFLSCLVGWHFGSFLAFAVVMVVLVFPLWHPSESTWMDPLSFSFCCLGSDTWGTCLSLNTSQGCDRPMSYRQITLGLSPSSAT